VTTGRPISRQLPRHLY